MEQLYVHQIYDSIGHNFSSSRHSAWPNVKKFLADLPAGYHVLDAGCGNGKNMILRPDLNFIGCDTSQTLLDICKEKGLNVIKSNIVKLPFDDNHFDAIICVAVLHHLCTFERRKLAVEEFMRVLKPGGKLFIEVWAYEQNLTQKFIKISSDLNSDLTKNNNIKTLGNNDSVHNNVENYPEECDNYRDHDYFVTWQNKYKRYYHLFDETEMLEMFPGSQIGFQKDNWYVIVNKDNSS